MTSLEEFMGSASPALVGGSSPWASRYASELRRIWLHHASQDARTLQRHLGPSELGVECDRQVVGKLSGWASTNHVADPWPSIRGKALHKHAEEVFSYENLRTGYLRWVPEQRVVPHPEHPGTADLYDAQEQAVIDHKFLGDSSMSKIRSRPPIKYVVQLLLYGLGYFLLGLPVKRVAIAAYPATAASLDGLYVWEKAWSGPDGKPLPEVESLITKVFADTARRKVYAEQVKLNQLNIMQVPAHPDDAECYFCPFYRPQSGHDSGPGCPGTVATNKPY